MIEPPKDFTIIFRTPLPDVSEVSWEEWDKVVKENDDDRNKCQD